MLRIFLVALLCITSQLPARENPFFPAQGEKDIPYTTNADLTKQPLKRASMSLDPRARVIKGVTIKYQNLDGSIESKSIELDNTIDWHLPIFVSQNIDVTPSTPTKAKPKVKKSSKPKFVKLATTPHAKFYGSKKQLSIVTGDIIMRNFLLVKPHRIVLDFKRDTNIKSYTKTNPKSIFKKIRVGNHSGYYRAVIELDGHYRYTLSKVKGGYSITLR